MNIEKEAQNEHISVQETTLEIRLDNLQHNVKFLKSKLKENTLFMAVVKAFSYGNNHCEIAKYLEKRFSRLLCCSLCLRRG